MTLAETVKAWRKREGITAREAALRLGIPKRTLQSIEGGRHYSADSLLRLAIERLETKNDTR
jgi:transcriptional regulator with XRE-family HTH domain